MERLKKYLQEHDALNSADICRAIDWDQSSFSKWRAGKEGRGIPDDKRIKLEQFLEDYGYLAEVEKAEAQLLGYYYARSGESLASLVQSMGLQEWEWEIIKKDFEPTYLTDQDFEEIEEAINEG